MKFCDERIQKHLLNGGKIKRNDDNTIFGINSCKRLSCGYLFNSAYILTEDDLLYNGWKIIEPEYNWNKIIKDKVLCVFSDYEDFKSFNISLLKEIDKISYDEDVYKTNEGIMYDYCKPFNPAEYNIAKDLKEYEK